eukprot:TCONS_00027017-protein
MANMFLYLVLINIFVTVSLAVPQNGESRVIRDILQNYSVDARPVSNDSDPVRLKIGLELNQVIDIIEKSERIDAFFFIRQFWTDNQLVWDAKDYNNVHHIHLSPSKVWKPDIVLYNNIENDKKFGGSLDQLNNRVIVQSNGEVAWLTPALLIAKCPMNIKYFPFDEQECTFEFGSWTYDGSQLDVDVRSTEINLKSYTANSEWKLESATMKQINMTYTCCPNTHFPIIHATVKLHRKPLYYLLNMIFPMVLISLMTTLTFFLPAESGERVGLAITLFLSMTVFMLIVDSLMPETSDTVPIVTIFFGAAMLEMMVMIVATCVILKMHSAVHPLPKWVRGLLYENLSYKLGIRQKTKVLPSDEEEKKKDSMTSFSKENNGYFHVPENNLQRIKLMRDQNQNEAALSAMNGANTALTHRNSQTQMFSNEMMKKMDMIVERLENDADDEKIKREWKICAYTLDRLLLVTFVIIFIITVLACFVTASFHGETE